MSIRSRAVLATAFACAPLVILSACGDSGGTASGARSTLQYVPATNYVLQEPATTTTTVTVPDDESEPGGVSEGEQSYEVQSGDGLFGIAQRHGTDMETICEYNNWDTCGTERTIMPGEIIRIPPGLQVPSDGGGAATAGNDGDTAAGEAEDSLDTPADDGEEAGCVHTIAAGENPGRVASQYGITFEQLQSANPSRDFRTWFLVDAEINIPPEGDC